MAKYIIDIEDVPFGRNDDPFFPHGMDELYRAKGFKSLVFDQNGLNKLTPYAEPDRKAIEDEVWGFAKIFMDDMGVDDLEVVNGDTIKRYFAMTYQEAKAKYEAWKAEKAEIRVGDELVNHLCRAYVIYHIDRDKQLAYGIDVTRGYPLPQEVFPMHRSYTPNKTGRHFDEVEELLKKMKEKQNET